jgi:hypothetical protein
MILIFNTDNINKYFDINILINIFKMLRRVRYGWWIETLASVLPVRPAVVSRSNPPDSFSILAFQQETSNHATATAQSKTHHGGRKERNNSPTGRYVAYRRRKRSTHLSGT